MVNLEMGTFLDPKDGQTVLSLLHPFEHFPSGPLSTLHPIPLQLLAPP